MSKEWSYVKYPFWIPYLPEYLKAFVVSISILETQICFTLGQFQHLPGKKNKRKLFKPTLNPNTLHIQGVTGGKDQTSGECSLGQTIPI